MDQSTTWMVVIVGALFGLVGIIYAYLRATTSKTDDRLNQHVAEDVKAHERIARLETKVDTIEGEVDGLRRRWHDLRDITLRDLGDLYQEKLAAAKAEILRLLGK